MENKVIIEDSLKTAVFMVGGKGTRLAPITGDLPKAMVNIKGTGALYNGTARDTILEHQMKILHDNGITNFILVVGAKKEYIQAAFTSEIINRNLGVNDISISYFEESAPLGTAGAFCSKELQDMIDGQSFLFAYADVLFDVNVQDMFNYYKLQNADAAVLISPCSEPDDRPLCVIGDDGSEVVSLIPKQGKQDGPRGGVFSNTPKNGLMILNKSAFSVLPVFPTYLDMEENVLSKLIYDGRFRVVAWNSPCYIKDIGTVNRFYEGTKELAFGIPETKNPARFPQSCVILKASDSIIFDKNGHASANEEIATAITYLNQHGVITIMYDDLDEENSFANCSPKDAAIISAIQSKLIDTLLVRSGGAYVNAQIDTPNDLVKVIEGWNISSDNLFYLSSSPNQGCIITKLNPEQLSVEIPNFSTAVQEIVINHQEMQQIFRTQQKGIRDITHTLPTPADAAAFELPEAPEKNK